MISHASFQSGFSAVPPQQPAIRQSGPPEHLPKSLIAIFLIVLVDVMGLSIIIPLLPFYTEHMGGSAFTVGALLSIYSFCQLLAGPVLGQISDRVGRKPVLMVSQAGTFFGFILLALSNALWMLFLARTLDGITAGNMSVAQAYVSDNTSIRQRTQAFGIIGAAFGLGMLIGPAISGLLAAYSLRTPIWAAAGLSLMSILSTWLFLPAGKQAATSSPATRKVRPTRAVLAAFRSSATGRLFWLLTLFYFGFSSFVSGLALFLAARFRWHGHSFTAQNAGLVFAYAGLISFIVQFVLLKPITEGFSSRGILVTAFLLMGGGFTGIGFAPGLGMLLAALTLNNVGSALLRPVITSEISKRSPRNEQGVATGVNQSVMAGCSILAPLATGLLIQHELYRMWAMWASLFAFGGFLLALNLKSTPITTNSCQETASA